MCLAGSFLILMFGVLVFGFTVGSYTTRREQGVETRKHHVRAKPHCGVGASIFLCSAVVQHKGRAISLFTKGAHLGI